MSNVKQFSFNLIVFFTILMMSIDLSQSKKFIMGYLTGSQRKPGDEEYSRPGLQISGAISLAVTEINTHQPLVDNHTLDFIVAETYGNESQSIRETARLWAEQQVSSYIGPQETCLHEARMADSFNLPMISYFCANPETSNKKLFSTFARTRPPDSQISKSVASVLIKFEWRKVVLLYSKSSDRDFSAVARTVQKTLELNNIEVRDVSTWSETYHYGYTENPFRKIVEHTYDKARIYVIIGFYFENLGLMIALKEKNLLKDGQYFVVGVDIEQYDRQHPSRYFKGLLRDDLDMIDLPDAFQSFIGVVPSPPIEFEKFAIKVNKYMQMEPFNYPNPTWEWGGLKRIPAEGAYLYDAVYVYARALNDTLKNKENTSDGRIIFNYIKNREYQSAMGYLVHMNDLGDAEGNYTLIARKPSTEGLYGLYPIGVFLMAQNSSNIPILDLFNNVDWINGEPPLAEPECGFDGESCPKTKWIWTLVPGSVALFILIMILFVFYRNWMYEQELDSLLWRIDYRELIVSEYTPIAAKASKLRYSSQLSLTSAADLLEFRYCNVYTTIGLYKGRVVALKKIKKKNIEITRKMKKELKIMKDLRHDNLNTFIGACVEGLNICIITDYCSRGSLNDVIQSDVKLDHIFIASMVGDIIRGMTYLHESAIGSHGNLKSSNCLVDSRWVVKVTDFGLHELKANADNDQEISLDIEAHCEQLLWKAPELLRDSNAPPMGSQKGDIYSFGIILYELLSRSQPFANTSMTYSEIIRKIMNRNYNIEPLRPSLDVLKDCIYKDKSGNKYKIPESCIWTMRQCWSEFPEERPDFKSIRNRLRPMRKGLKNNILDNMLDLMESYTTNLESIVDERTELLIQEKKKTEALLYKILPRSVADSLRRGQPVEAELFDAVTVFFSDIVGFTKISAQSSPLQIVDFLNDLYTLFDAILESYDVYKIETIGDAYMVVSGLPIRNDNRHASEIASMALKLLDEIKKFKIRHMPNEKFMMRFGIHTGPVCAGVVGVKMPRYCLFGDTVNTASRMESNSLPLKVHCSEQFKNILDRMGGYLFFERGTVCIKGKGEPLRTYWLIGESDQRKSRTMLSTYNSDHNKSSITEILFPQKPKSSQTPEMRSKQISIDMFRSSPRISRSGSTGDRSLNPLFSIIEKKYSSVGKSDSTQFNEFGDSSLMPSSRSQYSLNLFSSSKNRKSSLLPTSHSITINEIPVSKDPPSYKSLNLTQSADKKPIKEVSVDLIKSSGSQNGYFSIKAISLPSSVMHRKLSRTESLPQIKSTQTNTVPTIHETT